MSLKLDNRILKKDPFKFVSCTYKHSSPNAAQGAAVSIARKYRYKRLSSSEKEPVDFQKSAKFHSLPPRNVKNSFGGCNSKSKLPASAISVSRFKLEKVGHASFIRKRTISASKSVSRFKLERKSHMKSEDVPLKLSQSYTSSQSSRFKFNTCKSTTQRTLSSNSCSYLRQRKTSSKVVYKISSLSSRFKLDRTKLSRQRRSTLLRQSTVRLITPPGVFHYRHKAAKRALRQRLHQQCHDPVRDSVSAFKLDRTSTQKSQINNTNCTRFMKLKLDNRIKSTPLRSHISRFKLVQLQNLKVKEPTQVLQTVFYRYSVEKAKFRLRRKNQICHYFARFGSCRRGSKCLYLHDKEKVAICRKFLKGICDKGEQCLLSHSYERHRLPACEFYLKGECKSTTCPYPHIRYASETPVCLDFRRGYCSAGASCQKRHEWSNVGPKRKLISKAVQEFYTCPSELSSICNQVIARKISTKVDDDCPSFIPLPSLEEDWSALEDDFLF